jgi:hypothetical protein
MISYILDVLVFTTPVDNYEIYVYTRSISDGGWFGKIFRIGNQPINAQLSLYNNKVVLGWK